MEAKLLDPNSDLSVRIAQREEARLRQDQSFVGEIEQGLRATLLNPNSDLSVQIARREKARLLQDQNLVNEDAQRFLGEKKKADLKRKKKRQTDFEANIQTANE